MPTKKLKPRLAIGQPFVPASRMNIPESATLYGDRSGRALLRMGDNPNGRETVTVRPPQSKAPVRPVSLAAGGTFTVGGYGGGYDPNEAERRRREDVARQRAGTQLNQLQQLSGARRNFGNLQDVAKRRTLQAGEDTAYGQLGVARPADVDVPLGSQANFASPLARESIRSQEELLGEQFGEQNAIQEAQDRIADLDASQRLRRTPSVSQPPVGTRSRQVFARGRGGARINVGGNGYQASGTGIPGGSGGPFTPPPPNTVEYRDPFNPGAIVERLTPAEAKIRKARDDRRIEEQIAREEPDLMTELGKLSPAQLVDVLFEEGDPDSQIASRVELRRRGFSERAIGILVRQERQRRESSRELSLAGLPREGGPTSGINPADFEGRTVNLGPFSVPLRR